MRLYGVTNDSPQEIEGFMALHLDRNSNFVELRFLIKGGQTLHFVMNENEVQKLFREVNLLTGMFPE